MTAVDFEIRCAWIDETPELRDLGLQRTMAEFTIRVGDHVLTRHARRSSVYPSLVVPALPIASWLSRRWVDILDERAPFGGPRPASPHEVLRRHADDDASEVAIDRWARAHGLRFAGDGLLLPDVMLQRHGDAMTIAWETWSPESDVDFVGSGVVDVPLDRFVAEVRAFVDDVWERVADLPRTFTSVAEFERARRNLSATWSDRPWDLLARRLGRSEASIRAFLGPDAADADSAREKIARAYDVPADVQYDPVRLDSQIAQAARSAGPAFSEADHVELLRLGERLRTSAPANELMRLRNLVDDEIPGERSHRAAAYRRATAVRGKLGKLNLRRLDIEHVLRDLGCTLEHGPLDDRATDGIALWSSSGRALVFVNDASPRSATSWGRRSLLAHELYHLLFDVHDARFFGEATGDAAPSPTEPAANAFAAELLLPTKYLPADAGSRYWVDVPGARNLVRQLCKEFDVGWELVVRQLQNRRQLPTPIVDRLLAEIDD